MTLHLEKATPVLGCVFPYLRALFPLLILMPKSTRNFSMIDSNSTPLCSFCSTVKSSRISLVQIPGKNNPGCCRRRDEAMSLVQAPLWLTLPSWSVLSIHPRNLIPKFNWIAYTGHAGLDFVPPEFQFWPWQELRAMGNSCSFSSFCFNCFSIVLYNILLYDFSVCVSSGLVVLLGSLILTLLRRL